MVEVENQYCRKCQANRPIEAFEAGFKTCSRCREKGKNRYHRLRDYYLDLKKDYRQKHKEEIAERQKEYFQSIKDIVIICPVCNYEIKKYKKLQHEKSLTHQNNLKKQSEEQKSETYIEPMEAQMHKLKPLIP